MELRINDYVRTEDGKIGKIIQEEYIIPCNDKHRYIYLTDANNEMWYDEDTIIKSSPNIIDLIEIGDYVNGEKVFEVLIDRNMSRIKTELSTFFYNEIKSIVTHEQFSQMEYRIGE